MLSKLFSPRQEITRSGEKVVRSSEGTLAQARKPLEQVCSLECFRLGEKSFAQARRYSCPESIFAQAKIDLALWTTFAQTINFSLRRGVFCPGEIGLVQAKKKKIFLAFCF